MKDISDLTFIFKSVFNDSELVLHDELSAADVSNWDSLTHIQLIVEIEKLFGIKFALGELEAMKNVGDLKKALVEKNVLSID